MRGGFVQHKAPSMLYAATAEAAHLGGSGLAALM